MTETHTSQRAAIEPDPTPDPNPSNLAFSHPKNYLGVPVAVRDDRATAPLVTGYIVGTAGQAKQGAQELGLLTQSGQLTQLGTTVANAFEDTFDTTAAALENLDDWRHSATQFIKTAPELKHTTQRVFATYEPAARIINVLQEEPGNGCFAPTLATTPATQEFLLRNPDNLDNLSSSDAYLSHTTFQLKSCLYHAGFLHEPGRSTDSLAPETDFWELTADGMEVSG